VRDYLTTKGIASSRLRIDALGETQLDTKEGSVVELARNRRVTLRYFAPDGQEIPALQQLDDLQLERR
jgi:outer membrane protein OmpA-like peptidoglycan-associated protein